MHAESYITLVKEIKVDLIMERHHVRGLKNLTMNMSILLKSVFSSNAIPIKNPRNIFGKMDKFCSKTYLDKGTRMVK